MKMFKITLVNLDTKIHEPHYVQAIDLSDARKQAYKIRSSRTAKYSVWFLVSEVK